MEYSIQNAIIHRQIRIHTREIPDHSNEIRCANSKIAPRERRSPINSHTFRGAISKIAQ
jgi:hypothetical protein